MASYWKVEHLRATTFVPDVPNVQDFPTEEWWSSVVGRTSDERVQRNDGSMEQHSVADGRLVALGVKQGRIDWTRRALRHSSETVAVLGSLKDALPPFRDMVNRWLGDCPPVYRMAFGAGLVNPMDDREKGFEELTEVLPQLDLRSTPVSDFNYRINRPRTSRINAAITINRLATWSLSLIRNVRLKSNSVRPPRIVDQTSQYIFQLDLDVNTAGRSQELSELTGEALQQVFSELAMLGTEIANQGDVA